MSVIFVPGTVGDELTDLVKNKEYELSIELGWKMKILKRPGAPLLNLI